MAVNNVGMNYTGHFALFLDAPDCEQVGSKPPTQPQQVTVSEVKQSCCCLAEVRNIEFILLLVCSSSEDHPGGQLQRPLCDSGKSGLPLSACEKCLTMVNDGD